MTHIGTMEGEMEIETILGGTFWLGAYKAEAPILLSEIA